MGLACLTACTTFGKIVGSQENEWYTYKTCKRNGKGGHHLIVFLKFASVIFVQEEASTTQANPDRK